MSEMLDIIVFIGLMLGVAFNMFRAVEFGDTGLSLMIVYIAMLSLDIVLWFILEMIGVRMLEAEEASKEEAYGYKETRGGDAEMGVEPVGQGKDIGGEEILRWT